MLGEEQGIKKLVNDFYTQMENDPKARECLLVHELDEGRVTQEAKDKLFYFLSGWLGGPNLFVQKFGHPMMRKRHLHVKITEVEKKQWLYCMQHALDKTKLKKSQKQQMLNSFTALAMRIQNH